MQLTQKAAVLSSLSNFCDVHNVLIKTFLNKIDQTLFLSQDVPSEDPSPPPPALEHIDVDAPKTLSVSAGPRPPSNDRVLHSATLPHTAVVDEALIGFAGSGGSLAQ